VGGGNAAQYQGLLAVQAARKAKKVRLTSKADLVCQEEDETAEHRHIQEEQNAEEEIPMLLGDHFWPEFHGPLLSR
jgi:hypothetical protein